MKKVEYKFIHGTILPLRFLLLFLFRPSRKVQYLTEHWNKLGEEGWEFIRDGYNCLIFKRTIEEES